MYDETASLQRFLWRKALEHDKARTRHIDSFFVMFCDDLGLSREEVSSLKCMTIRFLGATTQKHETLGLLWIEPIEIVYMENTPKEIGFCFDFVSNPTRDLYGIELQEQES